MKKRPYIKWLVGIGIALAINLIYVLRMNIFEAESAERVYLILTNSTFLSSVLMIGVGLLIFASNEGTFDIIVYGVQSFVNLFRRDKSKIKYATFYDYRVAHESQKISFVHLIIIGAVLLVAMFIFLDLYHQVAPV